MTQAKAHRVSEFKNAISQSAKRISPCEKFMTELAEVKDVLGDGEVYKIVHNIPGVNEMFKPSTQLWRRLGQALTRLSNRMGYPVEKRYAFGYSQPALNAYHLDVIWNLCENIDKYPKLSRNMRRAPRKAA